MKKLIMAAVAAISLGASAYNEAILDTNTMWKSAVPQTLSGICIFNNGAIESKKENVSIYANYLAEYKKYYKWLDEGTETVNLPEQIGFRLELSVFHTIYMDIVMRKVHNDDPNAYFGEVSGHFMETRGGQTEPSDELVGLFRIETRTDPKTWCIMSKAHCENNFAEHGLSSVPPVIDSEVSLGSLPAYFHTKNFTQEGLGDYIFGDRFEPTGAYTNVRTVVDVPYSFYHSYKEEFFKLQNISSFMTITNGLNKLIPSGTKINISTSDPQTRVRIYFD